MRSLSASSKGKAAGEGEGARTLGALPFPSRGRLARVATLAMAVWSRWRALAALLAKKRVDAKILGRTTVENCLSWSSQIEFKQLLAQKAPKLRAGNAKQGG